MGDRPRFSVIVPCLDLDPAPRVLADLEVLIAEGCDLEILIAVGRSPSRQRNLAVDAARGETLVFLDSDCRVEASHFKAIAKHREAGREALGGPVLLELPAEPCEKLFQSFFSHPRLTGPSSARYRADGSLRSCSDAALILCNMAVGRDVFRASEGFNEDLYPNEENEWMARLEAAGVTLWYDPALAVKRPQRKTWREFARTMTGYGRGRTRQSLLSRQPDLPRQAPGLGLLVLLLGLMIRPWTTIKAFCLGWLAYSFFLRVAPSSGSPLSTRAALLAPTLPLLYGVGQIMGLYDGVKKRNPGDVVVYRWTAGSLEKVSDFCGQSLKALP